MLNMALLANPTGFVIALIVAAIAIFAVLEIKTNGLRKTFSDVFGFIVDMVEGAANFVIAAINGIIKSFNRAGKFFGKLLGFDFKEIKEVEYKADFEGFKEMGQDVIENATLDGLLDKLMPNFDDFEIPMSGGMQPATDIGTVDKVSKVGKIDDDVNIADEDMKMLMQLAVQNRVNQLDSADQRAECDTEQCD